MLFLPALLIAQQSRFDEATYLLEENQFRQALEIYQELENEGHKSGALWLNMGIIYYQLDAPGMAKYYFLRSTTYPETEQMAQESVNYLDSRFSRRSAVLPNLPWETFFEFLNNSFGIRGLFMAGFFFLNISAGLLIATWFYKNRESFFRYSASGLLALSIFFLITGAYVDYLNNRFGTGVMVQERTQVHENPDPESVTVSTAFEGYKLRVDHHKSSETEDWHYIRLENGLYGWIDTETIRVF